MDGVKGEDYIESWHIKLVFNVDSTDQAAVKAIEDKGYDVVEKAGTVIYFRKRD